MCDICDWLGQWVCGCGRIVVRRPGRLSLTDCSGCGSADPGAGPAASWPLRVLSEHEWGQEDGLAAPEGL